MQGYVLVRDFRRRTNKKGFAYGWPISLYTTPEPLWGYDHISSAYRLEPEESRQKIYAHVRQFFPDAAETALNKILR